ncbi:MAG: PA0069 family radical SAM protein [Pseudomonadota bacterium]
MSDHPASRAPSVPPQAQSLNGDHLNGQLRGHPRGLLKGRASQSNRGSRYNQLQSEAIDDGWEQAASENSDAFDSQRAMATLVTVETPRTIINKVNSPFVAFDRSINPYRGCEHGCIYCFARPTHAHYGLSPGLDFETKLFAKPQAAALLRRELKKARYQPRTIAIGTNTDPYQPIEKQHQIMRQVLEVLQEFQHPVSVLTKSAMITRDIDILGPMGQRNLAKCMMSVTTLDPKLAREMEPRASTPARRLAAIRQMTDAGLAVGVMTSPMIPGLNDHELEALLTAAKEAGACFAGFTIIRLPLEVSDLFREWLEATYPDRAKRVLGHIRDMNGGKLYDPKWSRAPAPRSVYAKLLASRFQKALRRIGLTATHPALTTERFCPGNGGAKPSINQLSLDLDPGK